MGNERPKTISDRIDQLVKGGSLSHEYGIGYKEGYIAGATAEAELTQRMADALVLIIGQMKTYQEAFDVPFSEAIAIGEKALQQFKDGKGKEV